MRHRRDIPGTSCWQSDRPHRTESACYRQSDLIRPQDSSGLQETLTPLTVDDILKSADHLGLCQFLLTIQSDVPTEVMRIFN